MNEIKIQVNDIVRYTGVTIERVGLEHGKDYIVSEVTPFGSVKVHGSSLNNNFSLNPNQFTLIHRHNAPPLHELDALENNVATSDVISFDNEDKSKIRQSLSELNELSKKALAKESKAKCKIKFSSKPGSAVVHYTKGNTFHISKLASVEVGDVDGIPVVCIVREYQKDGVYFRQAAYVPVEIFDKIVYKPLEEDVLDQEVTINYDSEYNRLVYPVTYGTVRLDLN